MRIAIFKDEALWGRRLGSIGEGGGVRGRGCDGRVGEGGGVGIRGCESRGVVRGAWSGGLRRYPGIGGKQCTSGG